MYWFLSSICIPMMSRLNVKFPVVLLVLISHLGCSAKEEDHKDVNLSSKLESGHVMIAFLVRNKAHTLPHFLQCLENIDYPKEKISLWISADHNQDNSVDIVTEWLEHTKTAYHDVYFHNDDSETAYGDEEGPFHWSSLRMKNVIRLRQEILDTARRNNMHYLLITDVDNILVNDQVLKILIDQNVVAVAPMLNATASKHYANFWCGMDERGFYVRTDEYKLIRGGHVLGRIRVPMIHSTILIDLSKPQSLLLAYSPPPPGYAGPLDDIITFASSAKSNNVALYILNEELYGFMLVPMESYNSLEQEAEQFVHILTHSIVEDIPLAKLPYISTSVSKSLFSFDQVYVINLKRRPDRRRKMEASLNAMGLQAKFVDAMDGKSLNASYLEGIGFNMLPGFADPRAQRAMTMGEIGCFLSHYFVWEDVLNNNYKSVLVLEDDVRFETYFKSKLGFLFNEINKLRINWELIYLGRKILDPTEENYVQGSEMLVYPYYTYWTVGYMLSFQGAYKLLAQGPLEKMVPVDEYLPIMFDMHPETTWAEQFQPRNLKALSVWPLFLEPTHYTGEPGYFTDTEDSSVVNSREGQRGDLGLLEDTETGGHTYVDEL